MANTFSSSGSNSLSGNLQYLNQNSSDNHIYTMIDNYLYLYHINKFIVLPANVDSVHDNLPVNFNQSTPLLRSAPIFSYASSGPRSVQVSFSLHRDMMTQINYGVSNVQLESGDDYVDYIVNAIQAASLPSYQSASKLVNPPIVALRLCNDIFIKGIIAGSVGITYNFPILETNKYASIDIGFTIQEIEPFDANSIITQGSFRGLDTTLEANVWTTGVSI